MDKNTKANQLHEVHIEIATLGGPKFKAGVEISGKMNKNGIEFNPNFSTDSISFKISVSSEVCENSRLISTK